ncbi:unnamed protein product [Choristocarpus tenellus]
MLSRVLSEKSMLPPVCRAPPSVRNISNQMVVKPSQSSLIRRLSGGIPGAFNTIDVSPASSKKELGGVVSTEECQTLADYLTPSVGGLYLLPGACSAMLKADEARLAEQFEKENAKVYDRLKRRNSMVEQQGYPPTMC